MEKLLAHFYGRWNIILLATLLSSLIQKVARMSLPKNLYCDMQLEPSDHCVLLSMTVLMHTPCYVVEYHYRLYIAI